MTRTLSMTREKRPKDMTAKERDALPVRELPSDGFLFSPIEDGDIFFVEDIESGITRGFAQDRVDKMWFQYRVDRAT